MDYYEELGVHRVAEVEEIRRAWRNLARLLHPDQQRDEGLRLLAEKQMKRLNEICAVLTDPVQRLRYDRSLFAAPPRPRGGPGRHARWALAAALAVMAVAAAALYPRRSAPRTMSPEPAGITAAAVLPTPKPARRRATHRDAPAPQRQQEPPPAEALPAPLGPPPEFAPNYPDLPLPSALAPSAATPSAEEPAASIAGEWFYAPQKTSGGNVVLYPAEFIEVFIAETAGALHGRYRARYKVGDRPLSGDVEFSFKGRRQGDPIVLPWSGSGGTSGEVRLKLLGDGTLQVSWQATELGDAMNLASGTAVLARRRGL